MKELKVGERVTITLEAVERKGGCKGLQSRIYNIFSSV